MTKEIPTLMITVKSQEDNKYIIGTFKHAFIEGWNKKFKGKDGQPLPSFAELIAESLDIFLKLVESDTGNIVQGVEPDAAGEQILTSHGDEATTKE